MKKDAVLKQLLIGLKRFVPVSRIFTNENCEYIKLVLAELFWSHRDIDKTEMSIILANLASDLQVTVSETRSILAKLWLKTVFPFDANYKSYEDLIYCDLPKQMCLPRTDEVNKILTTDCEIFVQEFYTDDDGQETSRYKKVKLSF